MSLSVGEEIITEETIKDCIARDADAPIFGRLGLSYGKAVRFKNLRRFSHQTVQSGVGEDPHRHQ